jgi:orotate phosphoribosyltransferase
MILNDSIAQETAGLLLQINAIKLKPQEPFTWASGIKSPIYCDNRIILSYPPIRNYVKDQMAKQVEQLYGKPDVIAGVATGAIGVGALVADALGLPFIYVRPEPKSHGRQNQIEGQLENNQNVVVIEDLISTGGSSLNAVKALKNQGNAKVKGLIAIFTYGFKKAEDAFKKAQVEYHTLSNYNILIEKAFETGYLNRKESEILKTWRLDPENWNYNNNSF